LLKNSALSRSLIITRREVRDTLRDWRIIFPIMTLTLIFPWLMDFTANAAMKFVQEHDAPQLGMRLVPFLMLVVGFFPTSFSLVIALETFVGEKERNSLEPLLSMPISDQELYLGKMLAALFPPVAASSIGIAVYLVGLYLSLGYRADPILLLQVWLLTVMEALVMVSGAVVLSSQATSVRAANLLASFIITPMALLVQAEAVIFFWGGQTVLWVIILGLLAVDLILVRMGVRIFNREELLGREIDQLNFRRAWRGFKTFFVRGPVAAAWAEQPFSLRRVYGRDLPELLRRGRWAILIVCIAMVGAMIVGWSYKDMYKLPTGFFNMKSLSLESFYESPSMAFMPQIRTDSIFIHNVRSLLVSSVVAPFSFGALSIILLAMPMGLAGWLIGQAGQLGFDPLAFAVAFFLPHAILELPAAVLSTAFAVRIGASLMSPPYKLDVGDSLLMGIADYLKVFVFLVMPLLLMAAFVEANVTPRLIVWFFAR
jgi:uncharacterized membrane protein SpoIIM required for sporulation/ABC-type transport system involved in multi-copper enzyme maturation permease subunit